MNGQATLDVKQLVADNFGGPAMLIEKHPAWPLDRVQKWCQRGSLPGHDLAILLLILETRDGEPISINRYLEIPECLANVVSPEKPQSTGLVSNVFD